MREINKQRTKGGGRLRTPSRERVGSGRAGEHVRWRYVCVRARCTPPTTPPPSVRCLLPSVRCFPPPCSLFIFFGFPATSSLLVFFPCPEIKKISEGEIDEYLINETQNAKIEI